MSRGFGFKVTNRVMRAAAAFLEQPTRDVTTALTGVLDLASQMQVGDRRVIRETTLPRLTEVALIEYGGSLVVTISEPGYDGTRGLVLRVRRGRDGLQPFSVGLPEHPGDADDLLHPIEHTYEVRTDRPLAVEAHGVAFRRGGREVTVTAYRHPGGPWQANLATRLEAGDTIDRGIVASPDVICDVDRLPIGAAPVLFDPTDPDAGTGIVMSAVEVATTPIEVASPAAAYELLIPDVPLSDRLAALNQQPRVRLPRG